MSKSTWTGAVSSDWNDADNWSPAGVPGVNSDVTIAAGRAVASASIGTVNSITDSSDLRFRSAGTNKVTTFLDNRGELRVDRKGGGGGTILNIGGTLTNSGSLRIGNATLSAPDEVSAASLDNTGGGILLLGSHANQALLDVTGGAGFGTAGVLSGHVRLAGDSAIKFKSGEITSLAANAQLRLNGPDAFIEDSTALGKNSALDGSRFDQRDRRTFPGSTTRPRCRRPARSPMMERVRLDFVRGDGGSSLTVVGDADQQRLSQRLSRHRQLFALGVGQGDDGGARQYWRSRTDFGSSANQALLDVTAGSAGLRHGRSLERHCATLRRQRDPEFKSLRSRSPAWPLPRSIWTWAETTPSSRTARRWGRTAAL